MDKDKKAGLSLDNQTLTAIMFTDVANFSGKTGENEHHTLTLVLRDLEFMKSACENFNGQVMKTMGDGMLAQFSSAVQAVKCALEIQQHFAQLAQTLNAKDILQHRIGIHIGDVYLLDSDLMGDGVNVAARIQTEAEPGGICISQTVFDVVKGKLELKTVFLGPRELKHIKQAVPIYRILLDAEGQHPVVVEEVGKHPEKKSLKPVYAAAAAVILVAAGTFAGLYFMRRDKPAAAGSPTADIKPPADIKPTAAIKKPAGRKQPQPAAPVSTPAGPAARPEIKQPAQPSVSEKPPVKTSPPEQPKAAPPAPVPAPPPLTTLPAQPDRPSVTHPPQPVSGEPSESDAISFPDGRLYKGEIKSGIANGTGTMTWPNGDKYEGGWLNGKRSGRGTLTLSDGAVYEGIWREDLRSGEGELRAGGKVFSGKWIEDTKLGLILYPSGSPEGTRMQVYKKADGTWCASAMKAAFNKK